MNLIKTAFIAGALSCALGLAGVTSASALSLGGSGAGVAQSLGDSGLVQQVQRRGGRAFNRGGARRAPAVRRGGRAIRGGRAFRGGRGIGPGGAAAIGLGLGLLGAAAAASAAGAPPPRDYRECWWERRPVYNQWGEYSGTRRTRVCE